MGYGWLRDGGLAACLVLFACSGSTWGPAGAVTRKAVRITVTVTEPDGIERTRWPLTFGVPWPRGVLTGRDPSLTVREAGGTMLPAQARVLGRWPDGSVRWLLVDTQITLAARQSKPLTLEPSTKPRAPAPPRALQIHEGGAGLDIDTGALRFSIPKARFAIAERVALPGGRESGPITAALQRENALLAPGPPRSVTVLERGPLRTRIQIEGGYGDGFDYLLRVDAYAGQPWLRVLHTFINRDPADQVNVARLSIDWLLHSGPAAPYAAGVENGVAQGGVLGPTDTHFVQLDDETWRLEDRDRPGRLAGWFSLGDGDQAAGVSARWFWQQYPQGVALSPERIRYDLWAEEGGPAQVGMGAAKTHEMVLWLGQAAKRTASSVARPLVGVVDSAWIAASGALPQAITPDVYNGVFLRDFRQAFDRYLERNDTERWDDRGRVHCEGLFGERPRTGAYGMWNWGDWNFPRYQDRTKGCDAWGNLEYDTAQVLALGFAATGDVRMHDAMSATARHFMDVDIIHFQRQHPEWVGMNHPKNPMHFSFELGGVDLGHTWTEGLLSYYYLTGDERGLAAARGIADYLVRRAGSPLRRANPRQLGWPQIALLAVYEATGERAYLDAARVYGRRSLEIYKAEQINHWKHGLLADALAYTHAMTHDPTIEQWLRTYARTIAGRPQAEPRFVPGVAYVARWSKDPELRAFALAAVQRIDLGGWGKPFTLGGRLAFRVYSLLAEPNGAMKPSAPATHKPARKRKR